MKHDDDDENQNEHILKDREHPGGEHFVQRVDIAGQAGDQAPYRIAVEKAYVHLLDVAEDLPAHVEHDFLPGPLHQVGLYELQQIAEDQRPQVNSGDLGDPGHGFGAQPARPRRRVERRPRGHVAIHGNFGEIRAEHVCPGLEQDRHQRNSRLQFVGPKVRQKPAHQPAVVCLADNVVVRLLRFFSHEYPNTYFTFLCDGTIGAG